MVREYLIVKDIIQKRKLVEGLSIQSFDDGILKTAINEWSEVLGGLTGDQIKHGLESWQEDWPPSAIEFKRICLSEKPKVNEFGLDYVPECYRESPRITDRTRILSNDARDLSREQQKEKIKELKKSLFT